MLLTKILASLLFKQDLQKPTRNFQNLPNNLLSKGHRNGRFIAIPLSLAQSCAATEGLLIHGSPLFVAAKRDDDLGRLVVNYSAAGPNHIDKKTSLPAMGMSC